MTTPRRYLNRILAFLAAVVVAVGLLFASLQQAFFANAVLNGMIIAVLLFGIAYVVREILLLNRAVIWLERFRQDRPGGEETPPSLLVPMATLLRERPGRGSLSTLSMRSLLDGISSRLDESRDIARYLIGLLIFLGLLGTFWGLLQTIGSVGDVIGGLSVGTGELATVFADLKSGLQAPLSGMGTAFSSSLFGLAGALVLGFLDLQESQAQNRFYNDLEEWLSSHTRLSSGAALGDGEQTVPAYVQALLEQTAESLENLQRTLARGEDGRIRANDNMLALTEKLGMLTDQMRAEQNLMVKLAENQMALQPVLARLAEVSAPGQSMLDDATRDHIRNLDVYLARLLEESAAGRDRIIGELRSEIKLLARTIAALAEEAER